MITLRSTVPTLAHFSANVLVRVKKLTLYCTLPVRQVRTGQDRTEFQPAYILSQHCLSIKAYNNVHVHVPLHCTAWIKWGILEPGWKRTSR